MTESDDDKRDDVLRRMLMTKPPPPAKPTVNGPRQESPLAQDSDNARCARNQRSEK
jgi:hypothetical protein